MDGDATKVQQVSIDPARVLGVLVRIAVVLVLAGTAVSLIRVASGTPFYRADLGARFELYNDQTLPTWFASVTLLASVPLLGVMGSTSGPEGGRDRLRWYGLAALVLLFSIDEVATLHEYTAVIVDVDFLGFIRGYNWVVVGIPFVAALTVLYMPFVARLPRPLRGRLVLVALTYFGGALGVEMLNAHTASTIGDDTYRYVVGTTVEESLELVGSILLLHSLLVHLAGARHQFLLRFGSPSRSQADHI